jgi:hypothetical protein
MPPAGCGSIAERGFVSIAIACSHREQRASVDRRARRVAIAGARLALGAGMSSNPTVFSVLFAIASTMIPAAARADAPPPLGAPRLHIDSDFPVTLHEVEPFLGDAIVCQAPCGQVVDGREGQRFYFAGDEIPRSPPFALVEKSGEVVAAVHKGSFALSSTGHALMAPAILHLVAGAVLVPFMTLARDPSTALDLQYAAGATLGVGAALLVTSIVLIVEGRTSFRFTRL